MDHAVDMPKASISKPLLSGMITATVPTGMRTGAGPTNGEDGLSKNTKIYELIVDRLVNARYAFGERLLVKELAAETGASRQPIMSALSRLQADGLVRIVPQVGCEIISPSRDEIGDFFVMFQRMEGILLELGAARRTDEELDDLRRIQDRLVRLVGSKPSAYVMANREFHHAMHVMAHSPLLAERQRNNFVMSDFFITHSVGFDAFMSDAAKEHEQIIDAISKRQPERARLAAEGHIAAIASAVLHGLVE
jgi:DNA-binding GntR family transcriptional regulator